jgi:cysteinyl-tRNA synthetase
LILQSHYKSKLNITPESLLAAKTGYDHLVKGISRLKEITQDFDPNVGKVDEEFVAEFTKAINNDLNTAEGTALLFKIMSSELTAADKLQTIYKIDEALGLDLEKAYVKSTMASEDLPENVQKLIQERDLARSHKNYAESDRLRSELEQLGYIVEDSNQGTKVQSKS